MHVYVISGGRRHVKIGHTKNVKSRLAGLQTGCPFTLRVVQSWQSAHAKEIERLAHRVLAKYRWAGEWFDVPRQVAALVVGNIVLARPTHYPSPTEPIKKAIIFCRVCEHTASIPFIPEFDARFRCSKCQSRDHVHVVDFMISAADR